MIKKYKAGSEEIIVRDEWYKVRTKSIYFDQWLELNISGRYCPFINENAIYFELREDAVLFELTWI